jgi:hypothetical protein
MTPTTEYASVDWRVCTMCGVRQSGRHSTPFECILALRQVAAALEFRIEQSREKNLDRGRTARANNRFVTLDGVRMTLSEAARELGLSAPALFGRIVRRLGDVGEEIDLRQIGIDRACGRKRCQGTEGRS